MPDAHRVRRLWVLPVVEHARRRRLFPIETDRSIQLSLLLGSFSKFVGSQLEPYLRPAKQRSPRGGIHSVSQEHALAASDGPQRVHHDSILQRPGGGDRTAPARLASSRLPERSRLLVANLFGKRGRRLTGKRKVYNCATCNVCSRFKGVCIHGRNPRNKLPLL